MEMSDLIAKLRRSSSTTAIFGARVAGAADASRVVDYANMAMPCAYVCYLSDDAQPHPAGANTEVVQHVTETWGIAVKLEAKEEIRGQAPAMTVPTVRTALMRAIFNWSPNLQHDLIQYAGTKLLAVSRDSTVWLFSFATGFMIDQCYGETEEQFDPLPAFEGINARVDFIDPFDPGDPPSLEYDPAYPAPRTTGPDGRIETTFTIDVRQPP
jgi:hypothetical protein